MARKKAKRITAKKIIETLDISDDIFFNSPRISLLSDREIRIENYLSVLLYENNQLIVKTKDNNITIKGEHLSIDIITDEEFTIKGRIFSLEFSSPRS